MSDILKNYVSDENLVTSFPTTQIRYSRAIVDSFAQPALKIETNNFLKKDDKFLYINETSIDITEVTIRELCEIIAPFCISINYIEYDNILDLPAIFLTNIESIETHITTIPTNPFQLSRLNTFKNKGILPITSEVKPMYCRDSKRDIKLVSYSENNKLFIKDSIDKSSELYYKVVSTSFLWCLNLNSLVTTSKRFISPYIERNYEN